MADTWLSTTDGHQQPDNTPATAAPASSARELPAVLHLSQTDAQRVPSPGTQRALKAQTGRDFGQMAGPNADPADRFQTIIWATLRRDHPGLRWEECADVDIVIDDAAGPALDPTSLGSFGTSPPSADSGD